MNKILRTSGFAILISTFILLTGCIKNNGNTTQGNLIGTVILSNGIPCIDVDKMNTKITGNGISAADIDKRIQCDYLIDWDNQPDNATVFQATLSNIQFWVIYGYSTSQTITVADSDPLRRISMPYITYDYNGYGDNIITFQTETYRGNNTKLSLVEKLPAEGEEADNTTKTVILKFEEGTTDKLSTEVQWRSFTIPKQAGVKKLVIQFKNAEKPGWATTIKDIENAYSVMLDYTNTASEQ